MHSHPVPLALVTAAALCGTGCTVISQYQDVQSTQQRVNAKEAELADEERLQADLHNQMKQLSADLANRKMTSDELDRRLAALQKRNDQLAATNAQERQKTAQARAELAQYRAQLEALQRNTSPDDDQTRAQITALKDEIRKRLANLANAE